LILFEFEGPVTDPFIKFENDDFVDETSDDEAEVDKKPEEQRVTFENVEVIGTSFFICFNSFEYQ
jgi:hypothetical protein